MPVQAITEDNEEPRGPDLWEVLSIPVLFASIIITVLGLHNIHQFRALHKEHLERCEYQLSKAYDKIGTLEVKKESPKVHKQSPSIISTGREVEGYQW